MTVHQSWAYRFRWGLLVAAVLLTLGGLWWGVVGFFFQQSVGFIGTPAIWVGVLLGQLGVDQEQVTIGTNGLSIVGAVLWLQWWFLRPRGKWVIHLTEHGRPLKGAIVAASAMAMLLTVGLLATLLELGNWWERWVFEEAMMMYVVWGTMLGVWAMWAMIFYVYWRSGERYTQLSRMVKGLLAGSALEFLIAAPIHAWASQQPGRGDCYCARGSYTGLMFAGTVAVWAFGPGLILLFLREKVRAERLRRGASRHCAKCDYDLTGTLQAQRRQCPECGAEIPTQIGKD